MLPRPPKLFMMFLEILNPTSGRQLWHKINPMMLWAESFLFYSWSALRTAFVMELPCFSCAFNQPVCFSWFPPRCAAGLHVAADSAELNVSPTRFKFDSLVHLGHESQVMVSMNTIVGKIIAQPNCQSGFQFLWHIPGHNQSEAVPCSHKEIRLISNETALQQHLMVRKHIADIAVAHPSCLTFH